MIHPPKKNLIFSSLRTEVINFQGYFSYLLLLSYEKTNLPTSTAFTITNYFYLKLSLLQERNLLI